MTFTVQPRGAVIGWSRMFSALAVAARPRRETVECYAAMLLVQLITCFRNHVTEYCTVIGPHSTVRQDGLLYGKSPDHFPFCEMGSASRDYVCWWLGDSPEATLSSFVPFTHDVRRLNGNDRIVCSANECGLVQFSFLKPSSSILPQ